MTDEDLEKVHMDVANEIMDYITAEMYAIFAKPVHTTPYLTGKKDGLRCVASKLYKLWGVSLPSNLR